MSHHGLEQRVVAERRITEPQFRVKRALLADDVANRHAHAFDQLAQ